MNILRYGGAMNFGYYPDDFVKSHPTIRKIRQVISLNPNPYR
jgi:hypothetical protein